ncbi:hypothetical protein LCGC14_0818410 [marine sediment metagenome]|uniref:Uncharacterized protein n=1 Tax=marine sediment metagenome TaxID=412755 RepID=A0A0F9PP73_9ZZZZ
MNPLREKLKIPLNALEALNDFIMNENNPLINDLFKIIEKYGGIEDINKKAEEANRIDVILHKLEKKKPEFVKNIQWLEEQRDKNAFISIPKYKRKILGEKYDIIDVDDNYAITLELSACQYFPFLIDIAEDAIKNQKLMPARIIRVRKMKEQEEDGDLLAMTAAMQIIGASFVETLDTKGTAPGADGLPINIHLGGPDTIAGYFGGVGQPNDYALKWVDEFLYYYTNYGVKQVLNVNPGTVLLGYFIYKLGINNEFKISVFMGNDNPYSSLWTLMTAKLFSREDGTSPLIGYNLSNAVNNETLELSAYIRNEFNFEDVVRLEHHITETWKNIVRQPYDRRDELIELGRKVKNISAKHEGGNVEIEKTREYPSDILDYFRDKQEIIDAGHWEALKINHRDRYNAVNTTAKMLTENGLSFIAARKLHKLI